MEHRRGLNAHKYLVLGQKLMLVVTLRALIIRFLIKKFTAHVTLTLEQYLEKKLAGYLDQEMKDAIHEEDEFNANQMGRQKSMGQGRSARYGRGSLSAERRNNSGGFDLDTFMKEIHRGDGK